eukprot:2623859-Pyramimonas_sp.AAC.1
MTVEAVKAPRYSAPPVEGSAVRTMTCDENRRRNQQLVSDSRCRAAQSSTNAPALAHSIFLQA